MVIFRQKTLLILSIAAAVLFLFSAVFVSLKIGSLPSSVILHFDAFRGVDLFGQKGDLWGILLTAFLMSVLNLLLGNYFFYRERIVSYILVSANVLIALLTLIALATIVSVN